MRNNGQWARGCVYVPAYGLPLQLSTMAPSAARYPRLLISLLPIHRFESCDTTPPPPFQSLAFSFLLRIYVYVSLPRLDVRSNLYVDFVQACELKRIPEVRFGRRRRREGKVSGQRGGDSAINSESRKRELSPPEVYSKRLGRLSRVLSTSRPLVAR